MPTFSNVHAELENAEIHPPRDFSLAQPDTFLSKNPLGDIQWYNTYWQRPVLGFANASYPPLTLQHGDRYILAGGTYMGSTAIDTSMDISIDTSVWIDTSMDSSGIEGGPWPPTPAVPEPSTIHPAWGDVNKGEIVEYYKYDSKGQPKFEWRGVGPQTGYQVFNLTDRGTYYFSGYEWKKQTVTSTPPNMAEPLVSGTYAALSQLEAGSTLVPGQRYLITDRDIILTAVSNSAFGIEGDYTQALHAHGSIELVSGVSGSIDSIQVNGQSILSAPVNFDSSLAQTASLVVDAINADSSNHNYIAINIGQFIYLNDAIERGAAINGYEIVVAASVIDTVASPFVNGVDKGERWFRIKYRFADDWIAEMADNKGNVVCCEPDLIAALEIDPYKAFPWAYSNVFQNRIENAVLFAYPNGAPITKNHISGRSVVLCSLTGDDAFESNRVTDQTFIRMITKGGCNFFANDLKLSAIEMQVTGGVFAGNQFVASNLVGENVTCNYVALNSFNAVNAFLSDAIIQVINQNEMIDGEYELSGAEISLKRNKLTNLEITATGASFNMDENIALGCSIDISGVSGGYGFTQNEIKHNSEINLQRAQGSFSNNKISTTQLNAPDCNVSFQNNQISNYSELILANYSASDFFGNDISSATIDLTDSTGDFRWNKIAGGVITLQRHTNNCSENSFTGSTITSNDSGSLISNNIIDKSTVKLSNTNGEFSSNKATFYSTYDLDGYLGPSITINKLDSGSELIANLNPYSIGGVIIGEDTSLNVTDVSGILYDCYFKLPASTIVLKGSQISRFYNFRDSNIEGKVTIDSSGIIELGNEDAAFAGNLTIDNTETLTEIRGMSYSPKLIVLRPSPGNTLSIDSGSLQIQFSSGIVNQPINGSNGGFVVIRRESKLIITELFPG